MKFIKKATVIPEHWIEHEVMGVVPREICLLAELSHPNIVKVNYNNYINTCIYIIQLSVFPTG